MAAATGQNGGSSRTGRRRLLRRQHGSRIQQATFLIDLQFRGVKTRLDYLEALTVNPVQDGGRQTVATVETVASDLSEDDCVAWSRQRLLMYRSVLSSPAVPECRFQDFPLHSVECTRNLSTPAEASVTIAGCKEDETTCLPAAATLDVEREEQHSAVTNVSAFAGGGAATKVKEVGAPGGTAQGQWCDSCVSSFCSSCARLEFRAGPLVDAGNSLAQGALVLISGLQKATQLNDQVGFTSGFDKDAQRRVVELPYQLPPACKDCVRSTLYSDGVCACGTSVLIRPVNGEPARAARGDRATPMGKTGPKPKGEYAKQTEKAKDKNLRSAAGPPKSEIGRGGMCHRQDQFVASFQFGVESGVGFVVCDAAAAAYGAVDRGDFIPEGEPYLDAAAVLGTTGAQVSAPHVHAAALELIQERAAALEVELSDSRQLRVLDLGSGSGFMAAVLARLLQGRGSVVAVEHIQELAEWARGNISKNHKDLLEGERGCLELKCEDARNLTDASEAMITLIRETESAFLVKKRRNYIYSQRALAEAEMAKSGKVPDRMKIFLTTTYAEYTDLIPVQDVDLCFSLLIFVAKSIFSDVHGMFDKYEVGEKGHMVQEEWNELCLNLPLRLNQQSMDEMWNFISSVHASGVRDVTDIDFTACMHVHDIEARDSWIVRLTEALSLDYYDMSVSEMESRIRGKSSKEASPVLDYNADEYALEHRDELLQDTVRPPSSGRGTQGTSLSQPFGLLEVANPASAEGEGDPFGKLKALQNKVSLNDFERRETLHLEEELSDSESSQSSVDSNPLSMDSESEMSEFDAQAFLSQQAPELQSMTSAPSKPVNIVVNSDESWRKLME
ncbi:unnamed protein product, partial [Polarella glacialis]